ncbi:MAG TPA: NAD(P)-binding protein [Steroidobacteraceae bacterium]|jgi:spermidine dehydrogenase|nr:NAD(P)-binding protein [Steroidobacteraceae bacterium]
MSITRRDFVNGTLVAAGAAALRGSRAADGRAGPGGAGAAAGVAAPRGSRGTAGDDTFTGYGGVGDYARSNGNTWPVVQAAHALRDGRYDAAALDGAADAGSHDLVIVGGGIAGLAAAHRFTKLRGPASRILLLENHPMLGGEAKQNEFQVDGVRLLGPQGSNDFGLPRPGGTSVTDRFFEEFALPREFTWQGWDSSLRPIRFARDNYSNMDGFQETQVDVGYFFDRASGADAPRWSRNIWSDGLAATPFPEAARRDLRRWRADHAPVGEAESRYLDTLTYRDYLERVRGYDPAVTRMVEPIVGLLAGVGTDAACARLGRQLVEAADRPMGLSFPGGNSPFPRALLRSLLPAALPGRCFDSLLYQSVNFGALDREGQSARIRLGATVLRVRHAAGSGAKGVEIVYERAGELRCVRAGRVVMASGGWINKHVLADMPADLGAAYAQFAYAPALIVNVALRRWRFLYELGFAACRWFDDADGFGYCCNIRQNMVTARHAPPLHPDRPAVLSFYMGLPTPGLPAAAQGIAGRTRLLNTSYAEFELKIRTQMLRLFGGAGFEPDRDVAGIVLNRWGHARLIEPPGFHYGVDGKPSPLERVRAGYGRVSIGHSELNGAQHWGSALEYGYKAAEQAASAA